ncbi:hypothetical protein BB558_005306 [Smittium angustum]|uniref:Uncharacterized protein n=1 Tax=Smittium angustum TaxID=133377 RepID=A0A2U1J140_SMIAN|nr:hypothetical protein BB558_005306 [Smittium angustum]
MEEQLSAHDSRIINAILTTGVDEEFTRDQLLGISEPAFNESQAKDEFRKESKAVYEESVLKKIKSNEANAVALAESGDIDQALLLLSDIIKQYPEYGSAYNNRAQVYRLKKDDRRALDDLTKAIEVGDEKVLGQAYTQRGILKRSMGDEIGCLDDFTNGAKYGNEIAKIATVKENPYAKMCNAIVLKAMAELQNPTK